MSDLSNVSDDCPCPLPASHAASSNVDASAAAADIPQSSASASSPALTSSARSHSSLVSPFVPQLSERDSIFATHYSDHGSLTPDTHPSHLPSTPPPDQQVQRPSMATSVITKQSMPVATGMLPSGSTPFDLYIYGRNPDSPGNADRPSSVLPPEQSRSPRFQSSALPDHLIALPPLSSPSQSPASASRPPSPRHPDDDSSAVNHAQGSQERFRYRSWREGKAVLGGRVMAVTDTPSESDQARIDKRIQATLPTADQLVNARSRKTSHHMRLFNKGYEAGQDYGKLEKIPEKLLGTGFSKENSKSTTADTADNNNNAPATARRRAETQDSVPPRSARGVLAGSLDADALRRDPALEADKTLRDTKGPEDVAQGQDELKHAETPKQILVQPNRTPTDREASPVRKSPIDDEADGEHISSAIYYPHQIVDDQAISAAAAVEETGILKSLQRELSQRHARVTQAKADQPSVPLAARDIEFSIQSEDESQYFHGDLALDRIPSTDDQDETAARAPSESDLDPSEADYDDLEGAATPKATDGRMALGSIEIAPKAATKAIALRPFSHQVGGHTAVYRFSRSAICKELNNKENKFYETVERFHPELLQFLPRYIGVLNVTFEKSAKRRRSAAAPGDRSAQAALPGGGDRHHEDVEQQRIVSHNQQIVPMPEVYLDMNRHIIPSSLFSGPRYSPPKALTRMVKNGNGFPEDSTHADGADSQPRRPSARQSNSWGSTLVNKEFREQIFRDMFAKPQIHRYKKHGPRSKKSSLSAGPRRLSRTETVTGTPNEDAPNLKVPLALRDQMLSERLRQLQAGDGAVPEAESATGLSRSASQAVDEARARLIGPEETASDVEHERSMPRVVRRRHSGSGLRRKPDDLDSQRRGDLQYFEESDFGGDEDDEVFQMDQETQRRPSATAAGPASAKSPSSKDASSGLMLPAPLSAPKSPEPEFEHGMPMNPEEARFEAGQRVKEYLLLEDLTSGLSNPCTLDLKMGTRQYGIDANEKKQKSQRRKCKMTTSQELGVRVCGMQTFNVKTKEYNWQDKYYGRDLKAGREFQDALTSFFYNGVDHKAAKRYIPVALERITALEGMVRSLPGYRFYGSSLYMIYDGASSHGSTKMADMAETGNGESTAARTQPEILFKIIDFANCVTAESTNIDGVQCPPKNPRDIDRGYLRGLRTLKMYFRRIWKEMNPGYEERGEDSGKGIVKDSLVAEDGILAGGPDDTGSVSM